MPVDERTFAAEIAGWVTEYLGDNPTLPFGRATVEEHVDGTTRPPMTSGCTIDIPKSPS